MSKNEPTFKQATPQLNSVAYGITIVEVTTGDTTVKKVMLNSFKYDVDSGTVSKVKSVEVEDIAYGLCKIEIELIKELKVGQ